ncbi:hypothetical protein C8Q73DRAFT_693288 [Cubamyces lactineus]|nr:hypothetical protein C8Q73DRAFT_693288 [Cubamyces lactineus]
MSLRMIYRSTRLRAPSSGFQPAWTDLRVLVDRWPLQLESGSYYDIAHRRKTLFLCPIADKR